MRDSRIHLSAEQMQAFLEGDLARQEGERARVEEHLAACARCAAELDSWRVLFADLSSLPGQAPRAGFSHRVMAEVRIAEEKPSWLASLFPRRATHSGQHLAQDVLQDLADGVLPARHAARAHAHLAACDTCSGEFSAWRGVMSTLTHLPRLTPSQAFAARVMAAVGRARAVAPAATAATARTPALAPAWDRALGLARRIGVRVMPRTRRAWAALCGVAVTPAAIFGLVFWAVFSHPTLTPQALLSFAAWQVSDLIALAWNGLLSSGSQVASVSGVESALQALTQSPLLLAGAALAYSAMAAVALRVLYKNLIAQRRYARVSPR
jgi:anti-sigma factor RsiW